MQFFKVVIDKIVDLNKIAPQIEFENKYSAQLKKAEDYKESDEVIDE